MNPSLGTHTIRPAVKDHATHARTGAILREILLPPAKCPLVSRLHRPDFPPATLPMTIVITERINATALFERLLLGITQQPARCIHLPAANPVL